MGPGKVIGAGLGQLERDDGPNWQLSEDALVRSKHYAFSYKGIRIDPYRIMDLYKITHPAHQHAIKKLLRAGESTKSLRQDVEETIDTLQRWLRMMDEDHQK